MGKELNQNSISYLHELLVENDLDWIYIVLVIANVIVFLIGWLLTNWKKKREIHKLNTEIDKYKAEIKKTTTEVKKLESDIRKGAIEVDKLRSEIQNIDSETKTQLLEFAEKKNEIIVRYEKSIHGFVKSYRSFDKLTNNGTQRIVLEKELVKLKESFDTLTLAFSNYYRLMKEISITREQKVEFAKYAIVEFLAWLNRLINQSTQNTFIREKTEYPFKFMVLSEIINYAENILDYNEELKDYKVILSEHLIAKTNANIM